MGGKYFLEILLLYFHTVASNKTIKEQMLRNVPEAVGQGQQHSQCLQTRVLLPVETSEMLPFLPHFSSYFSLLKWITGLRACCLPGSSPEVSTSCCVAAKASLKPHVKLGGGFWGGWRTAHHFSFLPSFQAPPPVSPGPLPSTTSSLILLEMQHNMRRENPANCRAEAFTGGGFHYCTGLQGCSPEEDC